MASLSRSRYLGAVSSGKPGASCARASFRVASGWLSQTRSWRFDALGSARQVNGEAGPKARATAFRRHGPPVQFYEMLHDSESKPQPRPIMLNFLLTEALEHMGE